jgi:hypothetical protein
MAEGTISDVITFLMRLIDSDIATIKFKKKDGTTRIMKCTLNFDRIPKEKHPKSVSLQKILKKIKENKILNVFDVEKSDWRAVPFLNVEWMETSDKKLYHISHR